MPSANFQAQTFRPTGEVPLSDPVQSPPGQSEDRTIKALLRLSSASFTDEYRYGRSSSRTSHPPDAHLFRTPYIMNSKPLRRSYTVLRAISGSGSRITLFLACCLVVLAAFASATTPSALRALTAEQKQGLQKHFGVTRGHEAHGSAIAVSGESGLLTIIPSDLARPPDAAIDDSFELIHHWHDTEIQLNPASNDGDLVDDAAERWRPCSA